LTFGRLNRLRGLLPLKFFKRQSLLLFLVGLVGHFLITANPIVVPEPEWSSIIRCEPALVKKISGKRIRVTERAL
jgi:hypothetical protein